MKKKTIMHRLSVFILFAVLLCANITVHAENEDNSGDIQQFASEPITIYHTNDMHGALEGNSKCIGIDRVAALKKSTPNSILVDAGDATQGLPLASLTKGADIIRLMNMAGYDLMAAGNHEYDYGVDIARKNADAAGFPILAANVEKEGNLLFKGHNVNNNGCHKLVTVNGVNIGFFGLTTCETATATIPSAIVGVNFKDEIETAKREITELENEGADVIIAVAHLGEFDSAPCTSKVLANAMTGAYQDRLDAIIDGHSHTVENGEINGVLIGQTGTGLTNIGKITITPSDGGGYSLQETLLTYEDVKDIEPDAEVSAAIQSVASEQDKVLSERVCEVSDTLWGGNIDNFSIGRITETNLGNLITDAYKDAAEKFIASSPPSIPDTYKGAPVVAVENGGGIRASIPKGVTTKEHWISAFPFSNTLMIKGVNPKILYELMEQSLSYVTGQDLSTGMLTGLYDGGFLQIGGMQVKYDPNAAKGSKIIEIKLEDGASLSPDDVDTKIILVSNNFIMTGGNDFTMLKNLTVMGELGGELETIESYLNELTQDGAAALPVPGTGSRIIPEGGYAGTEYTASVRLTSNGQAAADKAVSVMIDGQEPMIRYTDANGILRVTLPSGPHGIQIGSGQQVYVNNLSGNGLIEDDVHSYPSSEYKAEGQMAETIQITLPSATESAIASGRNFYVKGTFSNLGTIPGNSLVTVKLEDGAGNTVRVISSGIKNNKSLKGDLITFKTDETQIADSGMPDLIWDGIREDSVKNGDSKCFYNDDGFAALIPGGITASSVPGILELKDNNGNPYPPLPEGSYTLRITVASHGGEILGLTKKELTIGNTENKILTRFSGDGHIKKIQAFAEANGYRIYKDAFPGYWPMDNGWFCEIAPEWRAANATEYTAGNVHFIIYNVTKTSATYSVELGRLQSMGDIDKRLSSYYYSTGEPGVIGGTDSQIVKFSDGDKLQLVRAEMSGEKQEDGVYDEKTSSGPEYDMDLSDGVTVKAGQNLSVYGVTAPIQASSADVKENGDNSYKVNNKIQTITYEITGNGETKTFDKEVLLERRNKDSKSKSELEFKHVIPVETGMEGKTYTVSLTGYDSHGKAVGGTKESFRLTVAKSADYSGKEKAGGVSSSVETGDDSQIIMMLALSGIAALLGAAAIHKKKYNR